MGLSVVARVETEASWEEVERRSARALQDLDARWLEQVSYPGAAHPEACIDIGPADPIRVTLREGLLIVQARSSPWGPGYHQRVVEVIDALATGLDTPWSQVEDSTGYWSERSLAALAQAFLVWAYALWSRPTADGVTVCLGLGEGPAEVPPGHVATLTGFKNTEWIQRTRAALRESLEDPAQIPPPEAREAFLWWFREPDAHDWIQLGRAICTSDVIWRPLPGGDPQSQVDVRERAVACFEAALQHDPTAPVPLEELRRLYELLGRDADAAALSASQEPFEGGYREGWIRHPLNGHWNVQLPGWLRAACDANDGHDVFWDDRMTVHVTTLALPNNGFSIRGQAESHLEGLSDRDREHAQLELIDNGAVEGYVVLLPYGGEDTLVQGLVGREGELVSFTVVVRSPECREVALRLGRSLVPLP